MLKYIIRRIIAMIPVVIGITFLVFMIMQLAPGDPVQMILGDNASPEAVEAMRDEMGLNDNVLVQYGRYLVNLAQGDMGTSYVNKRPVADEVFSRDIVDRLKEGYRFLLPYYDYFVTLDGDPDPREQ